MKKIWLLLFIPIALFSLFACKQKKKPKPENERFFPVLSFIKSQVAQVDTSLYSIRKITYIDSIRADTVYYPREQFRELAKDFLNIPDLGDSKYEDRFIEENTFDETLNRIILSYEPVNPEKEELQRQEVLIRPDPAGEDKVTNIIIDRLINTKDSLVQKKMLWQVDKSFQVTTIKQLPGQPETNSTFRVIWNEDYE
jgi:hypothetical protein